MPEVSLERRRLCLPLELALLPPGERHLLLLARVEVQVRLLFALHQKVVVILAILVQPLEGAAQHACSASPSPLVVVVVDTKKQNRNKKRRRRRKKKQQDKSCMGQ